MHSHVTKEVSSTNVTDLNEIRDFTAKLMDETHKDVRIEPELIKLTGEKFRLASANTTDDARVDVAARGIWVTGQMAYFDKGF